MYPLHQNYFHRIGEYADRYQRGNARLTDFLEHPLSNRIQNLIDPFLASTWNLVDTDTLHIPILKFSLIQSFSRWCTGVRFKWTVAN